MNRTSSLLFAPGLALGLALGLAMSSPAQAAPAPAPAPLLLRDALVEAVHNNPDLRAALVDVQRTEQLVRAEQWLYVPVLGVDGGWTENAAPSLTLSGGTTTSTNDQLTLGTELRQSLPWGTSLRLRLAGDRSESETTLGQGGSDLVKLGPGDGVLARLSLVQPLLRGFGVDVGEAQLRQAMLSQSAAERARDVAASQLLRDVMVAWWELWEAEAAVDIEDAAVVLAQAQLDDMQRRVTMGAHAAVDLLAAQTRLAELEQSVLAANAAVQQRSAALEQLLGRADAGVGALRAERVALPDVAVPDADDVAAGARDASLEVLQARAQVEQVNDLLRTADQSSRARLDLTAWVQTQGLGNEELPALPTQETAFDNVSANVGLAFELPLGGERGDAQRRAAALNVRVAQERLRSVVVRVQASATSEWVTLQSGLRRREIVARTLDFAAQTVAAEQRRFDDGGGIALEVRQAEDQLRRAQLAASRAGVDVVLSSLRIAHLTGSLLRREAWVAPQMDALAENER